MYCQSCQTKLSPRDETCPTCGRRAAGKRDLGSSSSNADSQRSYPLPPASALDPDSSGTSPRPAPSGGAPRRAPPEGTERRRSERRPAARPSTPERPASAPGPDLTVRPADVRRMLVADPGRIEAGLELHREEGRSVGANYSTDVGPIDLLCRDDTGGWVVVVVAEPDDGKELVGDLLQRMGWVRRHLGKSGQEVRGIVLLESLPDDLGYAAAAVSDSVEFKLYELTLSLESVIV